MPPPQTEGNNRPEQTQQITQTAPQQTTAQQRTTAPVQEITHTAAPSAFEGNDQTPSAPTQSISTSTTAQPASTDDTVSSLVLQIFGTHEGEPVGTVADNNYDKTILSVTDGIPLGAAISNKVILSSEFIDLRCLLPHYEENPLTLVISPGVINLQQNTNSKNPLSINQRTDAFLVFVCIMIEKDPSEAPHLVL